jgi:hypothetical protein
MRGGRYKVVQIVTLEGRGSRELWENCEADRETALFHGYARLDRVLLEEGVCKEDPADDRDPEQQVFECGRREIARRMAVARSSLAVWSRISSWGTRSYDRGKDSNVRKSAIAWQQLKYTWRA